MLAVTSVTPDQRITTATQYFFTQNHNTIVDIDGPALYATLSGSQEFFGWAIYDATVSGVSIAIDGVNMGAVTFGVYRQDACDALGPHPGCPYVGWDYIFDTTQLMDGMHTLTVTATTSQGQQTSNTRTFLTNNRSPVPYLDQFDPPGTSANAPAVKCDTNDQNITSKAMYGDGGPDSLIHVTYSIPDYVSPTDAFIFRSSFNDWNSHSGTTGVNFQEIKSNQPIPADIIIEHTSNPTLTSCAAFWHYDNRLYYADAWQGSTGAQAIIEHEIGHYLGLDDAGIAPNPPSIMNQPSNPVNFCSNPNVETYTIQPRDASTIPTCRSNVKTYMQRLNQEFRRLNPPPPPTQQFNVGGSPNPVQTCTYSYYGVDYYVDGTYQGTDWYLDTVSCF